MNVKIEKTWAEVLAGEFNSPYFAKLTAFVKRAYASGTVYPPGRFIFEAFNRTPFDKVKAVILGQDPYHGPNQAHGLCFSVQKGVQLPPSLVNIYKELGEEYGENFLDRDGDLSHWADQGVLLLNATLTVNGGTDGAGSHQGQGWEIFTDAVVRALAEKRDNLVFLLWGSYARRKGAFIDRSRHLVLETAHPSPLSVFRGFFGCGHFRKTNEYLAQHGLEEIRW
jgi:uracil-DNA glycosylase